MLQPSGHWRAEGKSCGKLLILERFLKWVNTDGQGRRYMGCWKVLFVF